MKSINQETNNSSYLQGLNGMRAIAAFLVLVSHIIAADYQSNRITSLFISLSQSAVTMFFVLSGFIISYLIIDKGKNVNIKNFYARRLLRIGPVYYLYLAISLILLYLFHKLNIVYVPYLLFLMSNIPFFVYGQTLPLISHLWTIGVEEQFYIIFPWITRIKRQNINLVLFFSIILLFSIKIIAGFLDANSGLYHFLQTFRYDSMLIGAWGAYLYRQKNSKLSYFFNKRISQIVAWCLFFIFSVCTIKLCRPFIPEILSIAILCIIVGQVNLKNRVINLEKKPFIFLGKISYGMYIYHPLVITFCIWMVNKTSWGILARHLTVFALSIVFTIVIAGLSYKKYEKFFLKLKKKFS